MDDSKFDAIMIVKYVALLVILVSLANIGMEFTGRVTEGVVNVTIQSKTEINFTTDFIDFGTGAVDGSAASATLSTVGSGSVSDGNWTAEGDNFIVENIGNVNVTLNLSAGQDADSYLGGTSPSYQYNVTNIEPNSCNESDVTLGTWVNADTTSLTICGPLEFVEARDTISIDIKLVIPSDAAAGTRTDTFTVVATAV